MHVTKAVLGVIGAVFLWQLSDFEQNTVDVLLFGPAVAEGELWRVLTSGLAHNDFIHIAFNGYALWVLGQALEPTAGRFRYALIFLGGLFGGSLAVSVFDWTAPTLGASGAVLGIVAGLAVAYRERGLSIFGSSLGFIIALNLGLPLLVGGISFWGHLGGFVGGGLVALSLAGAVQDQARKSERNALAALLVVALAASATVAAYFGPVI